MKRFDMACPNLCSISPSYGSLRANVSVESTVRIAKSLTCLVGPGLVGLAKRIMKVLSQSGQMTKELSCNWPRKMDQKEFDLWFDFMPEVEKTSQSGQFWAIAKRPNRCNDRFHVR